MRRRCGAPVIALLLVVLVLQVGVADARAGRCVGATTVPRNDATRAKASRAMLCLVDHARAVRRLRGVRWSRRLASAARVHSVDMIARGYFAHEGPAGDTVGTRVRRTGYAPSHGGGVGEALVWGSLASPRVLLRLLMQSPAHRRILLDPHARDIGLGLMLGAPADSAARPSATLTLVFGE